MIQKIKDWFFYKEFKFYTPTKSHKTNTVNNGNSICILFDGSQEEDRKIVHQFKKNINPSQNKQVKSLAFINNKLPLDNVDYAAYNLKDVKWFGIPFGEKVEEFISYEYDLLIVLCNHMEPHYEYIIANNKSAFKIGPNLDKAQKYLDLIIEINENDDVSAIIKKIIKNIDIISIKK